MPFTFKNASFYSLLIGFHLMITIISYHYFSTNPSDTHLYWFLSSKTDGYTWFHFFEIGTSLMQWINYPFAVLLKLPFWAGHLLYGCVGFIGMIQFYKLVKQLVGDSFVIRGYNILPLVLFMPNMHFWTSGITKETLCFLAISTLLLQLCRKRFISFGAIASFLLLLGLRPHVALIITAGLGISYLIKVPLSRKRKTMYSFAFLIISLGCYILVCDLIGIHPLDVQRWLENNKSWRDSFIGSGSYVPIQDYNYLYKFFTFYFRPFFYDIHHPYSWILSIENLLLLGLFTTSMIALIKKWKSIKWNYIVLGIIIFNLLAVLMYVQRYAGLGIFARTRMMFLPYLVIAMLFILKIPQVIVHQHNES